MMVRRFFGVDLPRENNQSKMALDAASSGNAPLIWPLRTTFFGRAGVRSSLTYLRAEILRGSNGQSVGYPVITPGACVSSIIRILSSRDPRR